MIRQVVHLKHDILSGGKYSNKCIPGSSRLTSGGSKVAMLGSTLPSESALLRVPVCISGPESLRPDIQES